MKRYFAILSVMILLAGGSAATACQTDAQCNDDDKCTSDFCMFGLCQNVYNECEGYGPMASTTQNPANAATKPVAKAASAASRQDSMPQVQAPTEYVASPVQAPLGLPKLPTAEEHASTVDADLAPSAGGADVPAEPVKAPEPDAPTAVPEAPSVSSPPPAAPVATAPACANGKVLSLMGYRAELARGSILYVVDSGTCQDTPVTCKIYFVEDKKVREIGLKDLPKNYGVAVINIPKNQSFESLPVVKELTATEVSFCGAK